MVTRLAEVPLINGYYLPDWFSIVMPEETENLILNPSVENNTTGYTAVGAGAVIARTLDEQRRGAYSLQITPAVGVASGVYYGTVTTIAGQAYTLSMDVLGVAGHVYNVYFADNAGARLGSSLEFVGTGYWQRVHISYPEVAALARRFYIVQDAGDVQPYYVDGWQLEAKAYPTTYCDGDLEGFVIGEIAYYWTGTYHGSSSVRAATTRSGGRLRNLKEFGFNLLGTQGLGLAPVINYSLPSNLGGAFYQSTIEGVREFAIIGDLNYPKYYQLSSQKAALEEALSYNLTPYRQPLLLHFQETDDCNNPVGDEVYIKCLYQTGAEGNTDNLNAENFPLRFTAFDRDGIWIDGERATLLEYNETLPMSQVIEFTPDGRWINIGGTGLAGVALPGIMVVRVDKATGDLYVGGNFTSINGVAANYIARYSNGVWSALGAGTNDVVWDIVFRNGNVYIGGAFTTAGGAGANAVAVWNIATATWAALGAGLTGGATPICYTLFINNANSYLYAGGDFTTAGGAAATNIAKWNLSTLAWSTLDMGVNEGVEAIGEVRDIISNNNTDVWVTGNFIDVAGGTVATNHIARWNISGNWYALGSGLTGGGLIEGRVLAYTPNQELLVGGIDITDAGGEVCEDLALWNGSFWRGLYGLPDDAGWLSQIIDMAFGKDNYLHLTGTGPDLGGTVDFQTHGYTVIAYESNNATNIAHSFRAFTGRDAGTAAPGFSIDIDDFGNIFLGGGYTYIQIGRDNVPEWDNDVTPKIKIDNTGLYETCIPLTIENYFDTKSITFSKALGIGERSTLENYSWISNYEDKTPYLSPSGTGYKFYKDKLIYALVGHTYTETNDDNSQLSHWWMMTGQNVDNTDDGLLYVTIVAIGGGFYRVDIFSDAARMNRVGYTANYNAVGIQAIIEDNASGLGGYIRIRAVVAADNDITVSFGIISIVAISRNYLNSLPQARYT